MQQPKQTIRGKKDMKIKLSTVKEDDINRLEDHDCSNGFTDLKEAVDFINTYGDPHETYTLHITTDDLQPIEGNLHFEKHMELILEHDDVVLLLAGTVTVNPNVQVDFHKLMIGNLDVDKNRISEPDFVPLIRVQQATRPVIGTPPIPENTPTNTTSTTTTTSAPTNTPKTITNLTMAELVHNAPENTVYVKTDGNDRNNGLTPETAKKTIQSAIYTVPTDGTVIVHPGSYDENITITKALKLEGIDVLLNGKQQGSCITCTHLAQGSIIIEGLTIINGKNEKGGAIYNQAHLMIKKCQITLNTAILGGGIYNDGNLIITNTLLLSNNADKNGGGIYNNNLIKVSDSKIVENSADEKGGGFHHETGKMSIETSHVNSNSSRLGGGIYSNAQLNIFLTEIYSNTGGDKGGGLYNATGAKLNSSQFQRNGTGKEGHGGAIYNTGSITLEKTIGFASNSSGMYGGAIHNQLNATITGHYASFIDNSSYNGGAICNCGVIKLTEANYIGNIARNQGGAIFNSKVGFIMMCPQNKNLIVFDRNLAYARGGAIYTQGEIRLTAVEKGKNYPEYMIKA